MSFISFFSWESAEGGRREEERRHVLCLCSGFAVLLFSYLLDHLLRLHQLLRRTLTRLFAVSRPHSPAPKLLKRSLLLQAATKRIDLTLKLRLHRAHRAQIK